MSAPDELGGVRRCCDNDSFDLCSMCSADLEVTVEFLVEVDKLVQMIESPIFACECHTQKPNLIVLMKFS